MGMALEILSLFTQILIMGSKMVKDWRCFNTSVELSCLEIEVYLRLAKQVTTFLSFLVWLLSSFCIAIKDYNLLFL